MTKTIHVGVDLSKNVFVQVRLKEWLGLGMYSCLRLVRVT